MPQSIVPRATRAASTALLAVTGPCSLRAINVAAGASAGWILVVDAAAVPGAGAVEPKRAYAIAANASAEYQFPNPIQLVKGCVVLFSTTGPFNYTASATAFISADVAA